MMALCAGVECLCSCQSRRLHSCQSLNFTKCHSSPYALQPMRIQLLPLALSTHLCTEQAVGITEQSLLTEDLANWRHQLKGPIVSKARAMG